MTGQTGHRFGGRSGVWTIKIAHHPFRTNGIKRVERLAVWIFAVPSDEFRAHHPAVFRFVMA
jgi:hypothetical protein